MVFILVFVLGICLGSFLYAWVWRNKHQKSIATERSECVNCAQKLHPRDLVPILSFIVLQGKCRFCHKKISMVYPLVELITGIVFVAVFAYHGQNFSPALFRDLLIVFFLEYIFLFDFLFGQIPWKYTVFPACILIILSLAFQWNSLRNILLGATIGSGFFLLQWIISKRTWVGDGDIGMGLFMGVVLGFPLILFGLLIAYVVGAVCMIPLIAMKKVNRKTAIAFGPFLSVGTFLAMMCGEGMFSFFSF